MQVIGLTDIGNFRKLNEDDFYISTIPVGNFPNLFMVADGLGGHRAGDIASKLAISAVAEFCRRSNEKDLDRILQDAFCYANQKVIDYGKSQGLFHEVGTTLVGLVVLPDKYYIANVGDSRLYLYRDGQLQKITTDHSAVEELQQKGVITEEEAFQHEISNYITRAVGMEDEIRVDLYCPEAKQGDILLLCTDGFSNYVRKDEIKSLIDSEEKVEALAEAMVKRALQNESRDNITVLLVKNTEESEAGSC